MVDLIDKLTTGASRLQGTLRRSLKETGLLSGARNEAASVLRHLPNIRERRRLCRNVELGDDEQESLRLLRRDLLLRSEIADPELRRDVLGYAAMLQRSVLHLTIADLVKANGSHHNYYFRQIYRGEPGDPFRRLALSETIVRIASRYIGEIPVLQDIEFNFSPIHRPPPEALSGSQLWHVDHDQSKRLKVFVFTHDMTLAHGPTMVLDRGRSGLRYRPNYPGCFTDDEARSVGIDPHMNRPLVGPAGSFFYVDTSRLVHCGSRVVTRPRFLLVFTFGPRRSRLYAENEAKCHAARHLAVENEELMRRFA